MFGLLFGARPPWRTLENHENTFVFTVSNAWRPFPRGANNNAEHEENERENNLRNTHKTKQRRRDNEQVRKHIKNGIENQPTIDPKPLLFRASCPTVAADAPETPKNSPGSARRHAKSARSDPRSFPEGALDTTRGGPNWFKMQHADLRSTRLGPQGAPGAAQAFMSDFELSQLFVWNSSTFFSIVKPKTEPWYNETGTGGVIPTWTPPN